MTSIVLSQSQRKEPLIETRLKVVTWNIWWRYGQWQERQPLIIDTLKRLDPDIVCLQEVWQDEEGAQADILADALGFSAAYFDSGPRSGVGFGNAILSRWPIEETATTQYTPAPSDKAGSPDGGRGALFAKIAGPRGVIPVFSTHLSWKLAESGYRQTQVRELCSFIKQHTIEDYPPIVGGDFNAESNSAEIRMMTGEDIPAADGLSFHDCWRFAAPGALGITWDNCNPVVANTLEPDRRIDYVLVGEPFSGGKGHVCSVELIGNEAQDGLYPSDHFGVAAELRY